VVAHQRRGVDVAVEDVEQVAERRHDAEQQLDDHIA
jgi:hypothetical protein